MRNMKKLWILLPGALLLFWPVFSGSQSLSQNYYYVATAVDSSGNESVNSNQAINSPCVPTAAKPTCVLTWTASVTVPVAGYNIYRGTVSGGPYTKVNTSLVTTLTYTDTFLFPAAPTALTVANK